MNRLKYIIISIFLTWIILPVLGTGNLVYADAWIDGTPAFHEEALFLAKVIGHDDTVMRAPALGVISGPPAYEVGDERAYYAINVLTNRQYSLTASLRGVSDKAYIFLEDGRPVSSDKINALLDSFDRIYDDVATSFGPPPDTIDGDPRVHILIMDIAGGAQADGSRVIGYFSPINQYRNIQLSRWTDRLSNEVEMLYIDYRSLNSSKKETVESVVAHEFAHLIQWAWDPVESIWINEGLAVYVEDMLGYGVESRITAFEKRPDTPLLDWSSSIADYGAAYLFFAYVSERFGGTPAIAAILKNREQSVRGIELALARQGKSISFDEIFSDWVVANYLDDPDLNDGIYGYSTLDVGLNPSVVEFQYPITHKTSSVKPWAARYTEFRKGQNDALNLSVRDDGEKDVVAQIIEIGDSNKVSSVKSSNVKSGSVIIPQDNGKTILVVTSQPNPPELRKTYSDYDYSAELQEIAISVEPFSNRKITTWGKIRNN